MDGRQEFLRLLDEIRDTFVRKNAGYAGADNPDAWANFRHAEGFGIRSSTGVLIRISDKFARLQALTRDPDNDQVGESREDSALDMAVYDLIYVCLLREEQTQGLPPASVALFPKIGGTRVLIEHDAAAAHYIDQLCYAPESQLSPLCIPGNM